MGQQVALRGATENIAGGGWEEATEAVQNLECHQEGTGVERGG